MTSLSPSSCEVLIGVTCTYHYVVIMYNSCLCRDNEVQIVVPVEPIARCRMVEEDYYPWLRGEVGRPPVKIAGVPGRRKETHPPTLKELEKNLL